LVKVNLTLTEVEQPVTLTSTTERAFLQFIRWSG